MEGYEYLQRNCCLSAGRAGTELGNAGSWSNASFFVFPSLPSLSLNFSVFFLHSLVKASLTGREKYTKSKQAGQNIDKRNCHFSCSEQLPQMLVVRQSSYFLSPHLGSSGAAAAFSLLLPLTPTHCESLRAAARREVALVRRAGGGWGFWV